MGAWIEIFNSGYDIVPIIVAPLVGAWIEIFEESYRKPIERSLPSWERGLKYNLQEKYDCGAIVAPLVGAWIEIGYKGLWK